MAGHRQFAAAAEGEAVDRRDDRLVQHLEGAKDGAAMARELLTVALADRSQLRNVGTGHEGLVPGPGQDHAADCVVVCNIMGDEAEFRDDGGIQGIQLVRSIDRHDGDPVGCKFVPERRIGHRVWASVRGSGALENQPPKIAWEAAWRAPDSSMPTVLALDEGTTGATALVLAHDGRILGRGYREIVQFFPRPGEVEHDPMQLLTASIEASREALAGAGVPVDAMGIANQRETVVIWNRATLEPVGPALVWQDRRTAGRCAELRGLGLEPMLRSRTGLLIDPYFSATKLEWLLRDPQIRARAERGELCAGTVDSWLIARLTGGLHVTDRTNASRTLLADLQSGAWDDELLELFGVPRAILPEVVPSAAVLGQTLPEWFGRSIPLSGIAGDQQAALFGQGCVEPGMAKITYGTGAFLLRYTGEETPPVPAGGVLATIAVNVHGGIGWALEGSVFVAGAAVQWLRDGLGIIADAAESAAIAGSVTDSGGVVLVPAFTGLGAPYWNAEARGTITGLTRGTTRAHLVRATLEAIAHGTCDLAEAMGGVAELRVDGGAAKNDWLMQTLADLLDVVVERPPAVELTAYGAGRLAAMGIGGELPPAAELGGVRLFRPGVQDDWRRARRAEWQRAIRAALAWAE